MNSILRKRGLLFSILGVVVLIFVWRVVMRKPADAASQTGPAPIAVEMAAVSQADVPVYLQGLGTVQAYYTVTVTARVDGELQKVGFVEGQTVKKGDLIGQIDPRPFQAALDQSIAAHDKDVAQLASAKADMDRFELLAPQNLASKQTLDAQHALVGQLQAQIK